MFHTGPLTQGRVFDIIIFYINTYTWLLIIIIGNIIINLACVAESGGTCPLCLS